MAKKKDDQINKKEMTDRRFIKEDWLILAQALRSNAPSDLRSSGSPPVPGSYGLRPALTVSINMDDKMICNKNKDNIWSNIKICCGLDHWKIWEGNKRVINWLGGTEWPRCLYGHQILIIRSEINKGAKMDFSRIGNTKTLTRSSCYP